MCSMDHHLKEYFSTVSEALPSGNFHHVIPLHENQNMPWEKVVVKVPKLCKGWYELVHLSPKDRIEFTFEYWLSRLPFHVRELENFKQFFASLDDIGLFIYQEGSSSAYDAQLVYSIKENGGFFHGRIGATDEEINQMSNSFIETALPEDYYAFLRLHNGFSKATDTGILNTNSMLKNYEEFQNLLNEEPLRSPNGNIINPHSLIPFYQSFGMPVFQCFWTDWYPQNEIGNVYLSFLTKTISDTQKNISSTENLAFPTFLDWLFFYLEKVAGT